MILLCFLGLVWFVFFITQFSSLITHHFKNYTYLAPSINFYHSIFFTLFVGPITVTHCRLFFFFSLEKILTEPTKKKKGQPGEERKKKKSKVVKSCGWVLFVGSYVCLIIILLLSYELWKLKTIKSCFQFP